MAKKQSQAQAKAPQHGAHRGSSIIKKKRGRPTNASKLAQAAPLANDTRQHDYIRRPSPVIASNITHTNYNKASDTISETSLVPVSSSRRVTLKNSLDAQRSRFDQGEQYSSPATPLIDRNSLILTQRRGSVHDRLRPPPMTEPCMDQKPSPDNWQQTLGKHNFNYNTNPLTDRLISDKADLKLLCNMPKFNGEAQDNFNSWAFGVKMVIQDYGAGCTEAQKLAAVRTHIGGRAREIVYHCGEIHTVQELLFQMDKTYARDSREVLADAKQHKDESVRVYATRLKTNLKLLGWSSDDAAKSSVVHLDFFMKGLLPEIANKIKDLLPISLDHATHLANTAENQLKDSPDSQKRKKDLFKKWTN